MPATSAISELPQAPHQPDTLSPGFDFDSLGLPEEARRLALANFAIRNATSPDIGPTTSDPLKNTVANPAPLPSDTESHGAETTLGLLDLIDSNLLEGVVTDAEPATGEEHAPTRDPLNGMATPIRGPSDRDYALYYQMHVAELPDKGVRFPNAPALLTSKESTAAEASSNVPYAAAEAPSGGVPHEAVSFPEAPAWLKALVGPAAEAIDDDHSEGGANAVLRIVADALNRLQSAVHTGAEATANGASRFGLAVRRGYEHLRDAAHQAITNARPYIASDLAHLRTAWRTARSLPIDGNNGYALLDMSLTIASIGEYPIRRGARLVRRQLANITSGLAPIGANISTEVARFAAPLLEITNRALIGSIAVGWETFWHYNHHTGQRSTLLQRINGTVTAVQVNWHNEQPRIDDAVAQLQAATAHTSELRTRLHQTWANIRTVGTTVSVNTIEGLGRITGMGAVADRIIEWQQRRATSAAPDSILIASTQPVWMQNTMPQPGVSDLVYTAAHTAGSRPTVPHVASPLQQPTVTEHSTDGDDTTPTLVPTDSDPGDSDLFMAEPLSACTVLQPDGTPVDLNRILTQPPAGSHWMVELIKVSDDGHTSEPLYIGYPHPSQVVDAIRGWLEDDPGIRLGGYHLVPNEPIADLSEKAAPATQPLLEVLEVAPVGMQEVVVTAAPEETADDRAQAVTNTFGVIARHVLRTGFAPPDRDLRIPEDKQAIIERIVIRPIRAAIRQAAQDTPALQLALGALASDEGSFIPGILAYAVAVHHASEQSLSPQVLAQQVPALQGQVLTALEEMGNQLRDEQISHWSQRLPNVRLAIEQLQPMGVQAGDYRQPEIPQAIAGVVIARLYSRTNPDTINMLHTVRDRSETLGDTPLITRVSDALQVAGIFEIPDESSLERLVDVVEESLEVATSMQVLREKSAPLNLVPPTILSDPQPQPSDSGQSIPIRQADDEQARRQNTAARQTDRAVGSIPASHGRQAPRTDTRPDTIGRPAGNPRLRALGLWPYNTNPYAHKSNGQPHSPAMATQQSTRTPRTDQGVPDSPSLAPTPQPLQMGQRTDEAVQRRPGTRSERPAQGQRNIDGKVPATGARYSQSKATIYPMLPQDGLGAVAWWQS